MYEMYVCKGLQKRHTRKHGTRIQKALSFTDVSLYTEIIVNVLLKMHPSPYWAEVLTIVVLYYTTIVLYTGTTYGQSTAAAPQIKLGGTLFRGGGGCTKAK